MRETLYVKDDDWRLSLMMGNYVTLTNVSDAEFERILARKASPLSDPGAACCWGSFLSFSRGAGCRDGVVAPL